MKQVLSILFILVVIAQFQVITVGCANIIAPMGGPKDSLPPQLMEVLPRRLYPAFYRQAYRI